jgi:hypothetical protein
VVWSDRTIVWGYSARFDRRADLDPSDRAALLMSQRCFEAGMRAALAPRRPSYYVEAILSSTRHHVVQVGVAVFITVLECKWLRKWSQNASRIRSALSRAFTENHLVFDLRSLHVIAHSDNNRCDFRILLWLNCVVVLSSFRSGRDIWFIPFSELMPCLDRGK